MEAGCERFYLVDSGDDCYDITLDTGIALSDFYTMNPAIGSSCSILEAGYYVCHFKKGSVIDQIAFEIQNSQKSQAERANEIKV